MKTVKTKSYCISTGNIEKIAKLAAELGISESAVVNAMLSVMLKWNLEEVYKNAIQRRQT